MSLAQMPDFSRLRLNWSQFATSSHVVRLSLRALTCYRGRRGTPVMKTRTSNELVEPLIFTIRGHRVVLDTDLAHVYGATTKTFNQAFKRNQHRFPADFAFQLTPAEMDNLRSQFVTSSLQATDSPGNNRSQIVTTSHGGRRYLP